MSAVRLHHLAVVQGGVGHLADVEHGLLVGCGVQATPEALLSVTLGEPPHVLHRVEPIDEEARVVHLYKSFVSHYLRRVPRKFMRVPQFCLYLFLRSSSSYSCCT
jgi:hypothetical protein